MPDPASTSGKLGSTQGTPLGIEKLVPGLCNPPSIARQMIHRAAATRQIEGGALEVARARDVGLPP